MKQKLYSLCHAETDPLQLSTLFIVSQYLFSGCWSRMTDQGGEDEYLDPSLRLEHYCFENQFEKKCTNIMC